MWSEGTMRVNGKNLKYWVKHFEEPSEDYGLEQGRISKCEIRLDGEAVTYRYDRGLDIPAQDKETEMVLAVLKKKYN